AVPRASELLSADDLRNWGELGRRLAMGSAGNGVAFFASDRVEHLAHVPQPARNLVFQIGPRQLILSSSIALETFELIPALAEQVNDDELLTDILELAVEIANRSAKHSAAFFQKRPTS